DRDAAAVQAQFGDPGAAPVVVAEALAVARREQLRGVRTDVVPGSGVALPGVPQPDDEQVPRRVAVRPRPDHPSSEDSSPSARWATTAARVSSAVTTACWGLVRQTTPSGIGTSLTSSDRSRRMSEMSTSM